MSKNVVQRIWEAAGRFRSKTGVEPTVIYLGNPEWYELEDLLGYIDVTSNDWGLQWRFSGRRLFYVGGSYLAVGI
jgi:hypothetical protein